MAHMYVVTLQFALQFRDIHVGMDASTVLFTRCK